MARSTDPIVVEDIAVSIAVAWHTVSARRIDPRSIIGLKQKKAGVFVLPDGLGDGRAVVVKRGAFSALRTELAYYADIAPMLAVRTLQLYGYHLENTTLCLFMEDAGTVRYRGDLVECAGLTDWLVAVHTATSSMSRETIPPLTAHRYLDHLRRARTAILEGMANPALQAADRASLARIDDLLLRVEASWPSLVQCMVGAPRVLVHGDLIAKNIHVLPGDDGPLIVPLDWETAGWGVPAADLSRSDHPKVSTNPDLVAYGERALGLYDGWDRRALEKLAAIGTVFRGLAAMDWVSRRLAYEWVERPMRDLPVFAEVVAASMSRVDLGGFQ